MRSRSWKPAASVPARASKSKLPSGAAAANAHDPEKHAIGLRHDGWNPVFRKDHAQNDSLKEYFDGIDHSRARDFERRDHRSPGPDPASDGFRLRQGRQGRDHPAAFHPGADLRI